MKNLQQLQAKCEELCKEIEELKLSEEKIDFSKFIGRNGDTLAIKGEKLLKSYFNGSIVYEKVFIQPYKHPISYTETTLDKLKYGDVFCLKKDGDYRLEEFFIFIGRDNDGDYNYQFLNIIYGIERICDGFHSKNFNKTVYKFNRN